MEKISGRRYRVTPGDFPITIVVTAQNQEVCQVSDADVAALKDGQVVFREFLEPVPVASVPATERTYLLAQPSVEHDVCRFSVLAGFATASATSNASYRFVLTANSGGEPLQSSVGHPKDTEDANVTFRFEH